jgi:hypothetical protein
MMTVTQLIHKLEQVRQNYPDMPLKAQGWNDSGDLMDFYLKGDLRLERDAVGNPVLVLR